MNIALIGADGKVGSRISSELLNRGHTVAAIARHPERVVAHENLSISEADANDSERIIELVKGSDAVISALTYKDVRLQDFVSTIKQAHIPRLLVVGNAGSLEVEPGVRVMDSPYFPPEHTAQAVAHDTLLTILESEPALDWTIVSPPLRFEPGARTGAYRTGGNNLVKDDDGQSKISFEDFAVAIADELENPQHSRQRFSVAY